MYWSKVCMLTLGDVKLQLPTNWLIHEVNSSHFEVLHNHHCIFQNEKLCIICKHECRTWHNGGYAIDKIDIILLWTKEDPTLIVEGHHL